MKKRLLFSLVGLALPLASAFADDTTTSAAGAPIVIGVSLGAQFPFYDSGLNGAQEKAATLGVKLVVAYAHWEPTVQARDVEGFIAQGVQGIVMWPLPFGSYVLPVEAAAKAGIPLVTVNTLVNTDKVLVHVCSDDAQAGRIAAEFIIRRLGNRGSIIELGGPPDFATVRRASFEEALKKSKVKILVSEPMDFGRDAGKLHMANLILEHSHFDAVIGGNDDIIVGAIDAMADAHIDPASKVTVGFDAFPDALLYIKEGKLSGTVDQLPSKQAAQALEYLVGYIKNGTKPPQPVVLIKPELITKVH